MSMEFIRMAYNVPCKRGGKVIYRGRGTEEHGTITSAKGAHLSTACLMAGCNHCR